MAGRLIGGTTIMQELFGELFDFNHDGKMSAFERAAEFSFLNEMLGEDDNRTELELSGLDPDELEFMDIEERREVLENAGLNPDEYDKEAIIVKLEGLGKLGYVANSPYTVIGDSLSAGRLYDRIRKKAYGKVILVTPQGVLCKVNKKSLVGY